MRKKLLPLFAGFCLLAVAVVYMYKLNAVPTITYFPIDESNHFTRADSKLEFSNTADETGYDIIWKSGSESSEPLYLRQDASLLFADGELHGVRSKWLESTALIQLQEKLHENNSQLFQTISYHHGEIHYPDDTIKSIQRMSHDNLYVVKTKNTFHAFRSPANNKEKAEKKALDKETKQHLLDHWNQLLTHFNISEEAYKLIPLTELYVYDTEKLPGMTQQETNKIIGQLWEGIYKNYIIPATNTKQKESPNYIPIVLLDKEKSRLLVLFELNGKKEKLIQQL